MAKVSIQFDIAFNLIVPCTATHSFVPVPPVPPVPPPLPAVPLALTACAFEIPVTMHWPPGMALGKNKLTTTVVHCGCFMTQDGHDCGIAIVHVQMAPAPNNMLTAMHIPFSSRKSMFCTSSVTMNGKSPCHNTLVGLPPTPMMYCAEPISMPAASGDTSHLNTVSCGLSFVDWLIGAATIGASMLIDRFLSKGPSSGLPASWRDVATDTLKQVVLGPGGSLPSFLLKNGLAVATGLTRMAATDGPVSFNITLGDTYFENQVGMARDDSGNYSGGYTNRVGNVSSQADTRGLQTSTDGLSGSDSSGTTWGGDPL